MHSRQVRPIHNSSPIGRIIVFLLLTVFICGALFFAYQIFDTVREAVVVLGVPNIADLPSFVIPQATPRPAAPNIAAGERVNVLILGIDRRPSDPGPYRTDTMMLVTFDPKTSTAGVITIPRDLYVPIPEVGENRINTANFYGDLYKYPGGGPALAKRTVEYNIGRRVHYYVRVDFNGFRKIVNALGGIDIDVPKAIDDPTYPADDGIGYKPIHIPAGRVRMDGETALQYARTRHTDNDFGRSKRQIEVLKAIRDKALRLDLLTKLPGLLQSMWGTVETDMTPQDVLALAQAASKVKSENIKSASIDESMTIEYKTSSGADVLWPDRAKIGRVVDQVIPQDAASVADQSTRIQREAAKIVVLNGSASPNLAERTARFLQAQGYQIAGYGNADRYDYPKTVLIDYSGSKNATVEALAKMFRIDPQNIRPQKNSKSESDLRLILGADWTPPPDKTQP